MLPLTILLVSLLVVQNFLPLRGVDEINDHGRGGFIPQPDGTMKWMSDAMIETQRRGVLRPFQPIRGINFYLYPRANRKYPQELHTNDLDSVRSSFFDWRNPTRILIHGWLSNSELEVNTLIRDAYLSIGPHNIVVVNWATMSVGPYPTAVVNVPEVGKQVAGFIDFLAKNGYLRPQNLTIVGHSLGAHIAGHAGRNLKTGQLHTIIGLDPASSMFPYSSSDERLCSTDAYYVESIQTNGAMAGYVKPIGKATFYPNGGKTQLGCGLDSFGSCSHFRCYKYFAEAIKMNGFPSIKCSNYTQAVEKKCGNTFSKTVRMGAPSNANLASGVYYVPVRATSPYAVDPNKI